MIVVGVDLPINPDHRQRALDAALVMAAASEAEAGCIAYRFGADLADPNLFHLFECWESPEAMEAHMASPHMATFMQEAGAVLAGAPVGTRYEVASSTSLF